MKSSLKREVIQDPIKAAYRIEELEARLATAQLEIVKLNKLLSGEDDACTHVYSARTLLCIHCERKLR